MKKKYSTLLNFALAGCLATTLAACGNDGDKTKGSSIPQSVNQRGPIISIGGSVVDTNGNPLNAVTVSCQGTQALTNSSGQWVIHNLQVINTQGVFEDTRQVFTQVKCVVEAPAGYLGAIVTVQPEAQMDSLYSANGVNDDETEYIPIVTFIDGMYAEAGSAWLPELGSTIFGRLERCVSEQAIPGASVKLDMLAVDNNAVESQAPGDTCEYGCSVDYSTAMYSAVTEADGTFSIANVPNDSILRLFVEGYTNIDINGVGSKYNYTGSVDSSPDSTPDSEYITTVDEGHVVLGDVCADPITAGDDARPCVAGVTDYVHGEAGTQVIPRSNAGGWISPEFVRWFVLPDDVDGTGNGIAIVFNEYMDPTAVDENSVVIWNEGPDPGDSAAAKADDDYLTDFTTTIEGNALRIVTAEPLGDDDHLKIYLLSSDFRDLAGNYLSAEDNRDNDVCDNERWVEDFWSLNDTSYVVVGVKMFSPDDTDAEAVTGLVQECTDYSVPVANQTDLQTEYPTVFRSEWDDDGNTFFNLNEDPQYETRLEGLADQLTCPNDITANAAITNNYATISFMAPLSGSWQIGSSSNADCVTNCFGAGELTTQYVVVGSDSATASLAANVGDTIFVESLDDFDNVSAVESVVLGDCVAPTTVLNYAYNTCGYATNIAAPAFNPNAGELCIESDVTLFDFGDGGENAGIGDPGACGIPTLNITCRLLKDPADAAQGIVSDPITFFGLQDALSGRFGWDYDATSFDAWVPFSDTIGVAFSENIAMTTGGLIGWAGVTNLTSWTLGNNVGTTDDGNTPDGGTAGAQADLAMITVDDVLTLANVDHLQIMDFTNAVEDLAAGHPADNAQVVVNDLMPPFVEYAYWSEDGLIIQFNEPVDVDTSSTSADCSVSAGVSTVNTDSVNLWNWTSAGYTEIFTNCATLSTDLTNITIPQDNLVGSGIDRAAIFPSDPADTAAAIYTEATYTGLGFAPAVDDGTGTNGFAHGLLNTDNIMDAVGNRWLDWDGLTPTSVPVADVNDVANTRLGAQNDFVNTAAGAMCTTPEFAVVDVLGPFNVTVVGQVANFADGQPTACPAASPTFNMVLNYSFSHPLDLEDSFPGAACLNTNACTVAEVNSYLDAAWVDANVAFNGTAIGDVTIPELGGVGATLATNRQSLAITVANGPGTEVCTQFTGGLTPDSLGSAWTVFSAYEVGNPKQLGTYTASGP